MTADVASSLNSWSTTESSNSPSGSTPIATNLDDNLRMIQAVTRFLASKSTDLASSNTVNLNNATGVYVQITGTTTISGFSSMTAGMWFILRFTGSLFVTHNATSLILPGAADIQTAAGDTMVVVSLGSGNWVCTSFMRAGGLPALAGVNTNITQLAGLTTPLTVQQGGSGAGTFTDGGVLLGNGVSPFSVTSAGTAGQVLTSNGTGSDPTFQDGPSAASQAEVLAASSTTKYVSPGRAQHHPGVAKAWINFDGSSGSIGDGRASYNMDAVTDNGTGNYTLNFDVDFASVNYAAVCGCKWVSTSTNADVVMITSTPNSNSLQITANASANGTAVDNTYIMVALFGEQP